MIWGGRVSQGFGGMRGISQVRESVLVGGGGGGEGNVLDNDRYLDVTSCEYIASEWS